MTLTQARPKATRQPPVSVAQIPGLSMRDGVATILVGIGVVAVVAALRDWGWPLLGTIRSATLVLGVAGLAACGIGARIDPESFKTPYQRFASLIGVGALVLMVAALITGSEFLLVAFGSVTVLLWLMASVRHANGA